MRDPTTFEWTKHFAKNMDAETSLAAIIVLAIVMIALFAGAGGLRLGVYLVILLTIKMIFNFIENILDKAHEARKSPRRAKRQIASHSREKRYQPVSSSESAERARLAHNSE